MSAPRDTYAEIADLYLSSWVTADRERVEAHLTYIGDIDLSEPDYSFNLLRFYVRKSDGVVLYATDSGCSCPAPFEDTTVAELKETNLAGVERAARSMSSEGYGSIPETEIVQDARALLPAMREAGAR